MRDAMDRLVGRFRGEVVEHHHGGAMAREIMFDRQICRR